MTIADAINDPVFQRVLIAYAGSEGELEKLDQRAIDALAAVFCCGVNYEHPELPGIGSEIDITYDSEPLTLRIIEERGRKHHFIGEEPDGIRHHVFLDPVAQGAQSMPIDEEEDEPWKTRDKD